MSSSTPAPGSNIYPLCRFGLTIVTIRLGAIAATRHRTPPSASGRASIDKEPAAIGAFAQSHMGEVARAEKAGDEVDNPADRFDQIELVRLQAAPICQAIRGQLSGRRIESKLAVKRFDRSVRRASSARARREERSCCRTGHDCLAKPMVRRFWIFSGERAKVRRVAPGENFAAFTPGQKTFVARQRFGHLPIVVDCIGEIERGMSSDTPQFFPRAFGVAGIQSSWPWHGRRSSNRYDGYSMILFSSKSARLQCLRERTDRVTIKPIAQTPSRKS